MANPNSRSLRVALVTQYWPPEAHGALPAAFAQELSARGHAVTVVTTFPNHPTGRVFPGWRQRLRHVERHGAVSVRRVPSLPYHGRSAIGRIVSYCSFAVSALLATGALRRADAVHVHCAQPTAAVPALVWRRLFGTPVVLHVQDVWPESVTDSGMVGQGARSVVTHRLLTVLLRGLYRRAAAVLAISSGAARLLVDRGADPEAVAVCRNPSATNDVEPATPPGTPGRTTVVYAGSLGAAQGLEALVEAAARCRDLDGLRVVLVGDGTHRPALQRLVRTLGASNVSFRPAVPRTEMPAVHAAADFEVVTLADAPLSEVTVPSKFQDAMAFGVPVIAAVSGDTSELVRASGAGLTVAPGDVTGLAAALRAAHAMTPDRRSELRRRARHFAETELSLERAADVVERSLLAAVAS